MSESRNDPEGDRVSLAPLTPEEALRALLAVKPDSDDPQEEDTDGQERSKPN